MAYRLQKEFVVVADDLHTHVKVADVFCDELVRCEVVLQHLAHIEDRPHCRLCRCLLGCAHELLHSVEEVLHVVRSPHSEALCLVLQPAACVLLEKGVP